MDVTRVGTSSHRLRGPRLWARELLPGRHRHTPSSTDRPQEPTHVDWRSRGGPGPALKSSRCEVGITLVLERIGLAGGFTTPTAGRNGAWAHDIGLGWSGRRRFVNRSDRDQGKAAREARDVMQLAESFVGGVCVSSCRWHGDPRCAWCCGKNGVPGGPPGGQSVR